MPRFGVLGTFPPAYCGLASFTASLTAGLEANVADVGVVRVADGTPSSDPRVIGELTNGSPHSIAACANLLSQFRRRIAEEIGFQKPSSLAFLKSRRR